MHFEFIDEEVWLAFNRKVAEVRGWGLPVNTKAKKTAKRGQVTLFNEVFDQR